MSNQLSRQRTDFPVLKGKQGYYQNIFLVRLSCLPSHETARRFQDHLLPIPTRQHSFLTPWFTNFLHIRASCRTNPTKTDYVNCIFLASKKHFQAHTIEAWIRAGLPLRLSVFPVPMLPNYFQKVSLY